METYKTLIETSFQNAENNISKITNDTSRLFVQTACSGVLEY